ncbi:unnamed protein product [Haemonchus placei]|uniref:DIOX_N domain-containing protein n=1 Tax=Haemonchus placei TaxID=6290 RepID=A0A0N4WA56_HAEPC|nr:unnamed protein product [Haemonchus placei]
MNLRKFASNSSDLNKFFEAEEDEKVPQIQKLLGLQWNTSEDKLSLTLPQKPPKEGMWTKRKILKEVASIYDPLGFLTPFQITNLEDSYGSRCILSS